MGSWTEWQVLEPLLEVAKHQIDDDTATSLKEASELLGRGQALKADEVLRRHTTGTARQWVSVARADLLALHFTKCVRGVAWRLENFDPKADTPPGRSLDMSPDAVVGPGDISVEATLTNLEDAVASTNSALATQARIARVRMTTFVSSCPPNDAVARMAEGYLRSDLATLAANGHLTPDLAYVWAGIQMQEYSGAAARPFLEQARAGGFDDPSVDYLLAAIALELREYEEADRLAAAAAARYAEFGDTMQQSQARFIQGESARERGESAAAQEHYEAALKLHRGHAAAVIGLARLAQASSGETAGVELVAKRLPQLLGTGPSDRASAERAARNLEALVVLTDGDLPMSEVVRDAMVEDVDDDDDAIRRGLRYFYAATLDARLGDYERARGRAAVALTEFEDASVDPPVDARKFLDRLSGA